MNWGIKLPRKSPSLEEQIKTLAACGIILRDDVTIEHLLAMFHREAYENDPYRFLLSVMGGDLEEELNGFASNNIWHFDTECIFAQLLAQQRTDKRFTYLDLGGQDCLIGCCTPSQLANLNKNTELNFEWLT